MSHLVIVQLLLFSTQKSQRGKKYKTVQEENAAFMHEILIQKRAANQLRKNNAGIAKIKDIQTWFRLYLFSCEQPLKSRASSVIASYETNVNHFMLLVSFYIP